MKKILISLLACISVSAFASSANFPIQCNNGTTITASSTLADVQKCLITKQKSTKGMYEVEFKDNNSHSYTCMFVSESATAKINSCN